eukprot:1142212-Pelagomonas_calceolata.AAC.1
MQKVTIQPQQSALDVTRSPCLCIVQIEQSVLNVCIHLQHSVPNTAKASPSPLPFRAKHKNPNIKAGHEESAMVCNASAISCHARMLRTGCCSEGPDQRAGGPAATTKSQCGSHPGYSQQAGAKNWCLVSMHVQNVAFLGV